MAILWMDLWKIMQWEGEEEEAEATWMNSDSSLLS